MIADAKRLYIKAQSKKLIHGYSYSGIAAACLCYTSKKIHYARPYTHFAELIKDKKQDKKTYVIKCYKRICKGLTLPHLPTSPVEYISQFIHRDELNIDTNTERAIIEIINIALSRGQFIGMNPKGVCRSNLLCVYEI